MRKKYLRWRLRRLQYLYFTKHKRKYLIKSKKIINKLKEEKL